jgi:hypothetical protein
MPHRASNPSIAITQCPNCKRNGNGLRLSITHVQRSPSWGISCRMFAHKANSACLCSFPLAQWFCCSAHDETVLTEALAPFKPFRFHDVVMFKRERFTLKTCVIGML